jgi:mono/diheme cytochrome c family protein
MRHDSASRFFRIRSAVRAVTALFALFALSAAAADGPALYQQHCAACHGPGRLGLTGPALLPESLARLKKPEAIKTIG